MWSVQRHCWARRRANLSLHSHAASDRNDLVSDEPRRDKETSIFSLYRSIVGALLYMGHDRSDAACAIRLSGCDLCYANEDSLRRF